MKVLVTGGAGYIGSAITTRLVNDGHTVSVIDNLQTGNRKAVPHKAKFVIGDISDSHMLGLAMKGGIDVVIHTAASMSPSDSIKKPRDYFHNNIANGLVLLDAMRKRKVRKIIFSSSACVYGIPDKNPVTEDSTKSLVTPYGDTKLMFEQILEWYYRAYGINYTCFRYFNVAGAVGKIGPDKPYNNGVIPIMLKAVKSKKPFQVFGTAYLTHDGTCVRDYIHISDIVEAYVIALQEDHIGIFNLGSGKGYSINEIISEVKEITRKEIIVKPASRRPGDPAKLVANISKSGHELGWKPQSSSIDNIIRTTWEWLNGDRSI